MNEEKIDRRAHWIQLLVTCIVAAAVWCARLEFKTNDNRADTDEINQRFIKDHDRLTELRAIVDCMRHHDCGEAGGHG